MMNAKQTASYENQNKTDTQTGALALYEEEAHLQVVKLEQGKPVEYWQDSDPDHLRRLDIVLGEICDVVPALQAIFVDIGTKQPGFLPIAEVFDEPKTGQPVLVQIKRLCEPP